MSFRVNSRDDLTEPLGAGSYRFELPSHTLAPFSHTNSYLICNQGQAVLIDPGFYEQASLEPILETLYSQRAFLKAILLTHTHPDHQEGIALLREVFSNLPVFVHPLERMHAKTSHVQALGDSFSLPTLTIEVLFTPGHSPGHVSFYLPDEHLAFVGDMVAGSGSTWIGLPDGNYQDYFESIDKLAQLNLKLLACGHGPVLYTPNEKLLEVKQHRLQRLEQVFIALSQPCSLEQLCQQVYPEIQPELQAAARSSLQALLVKLEQDQRIIFHKGSYHHNKVL